MDPQGKPKEEAVVAIDQVFASWAEEEADPPLAEADAGPQPPRAEDRPVLAPGRTPAAAAGGVLPALPSVGDYVRELQAEFEHQEEGSKLR
jgi:hypothetical protein